MDRKPRKRKRVLESPANPWYRSIPHQWLTFDCPSCRKQCTVCVAKHQAELVCMFCDRWVDREESGCRPAKPIEIHDVQSIGMEVVKRTRKAG